MNAWKLTICVFSTWALLRFWIHPVLERRWVGSTVPQQVARAGLFASIEMLRNLLLRVGSVLLIVLCLLALADAFGETDALMPKALIAAIADAAGSFKTFKDYTSGVVALLTLLAGAYVLYRTSKQAKRRMREKVFARIDEVRKDLRADDFRQKIAALSPSFTTELEKIDAIFKERQRLASEKPTSTAALEKLDADISARMNALTVAIALHQFDPIEALKTSSATEDTQSPGTLQSNDRSRSPGRIVKTLTSDGLAKDLGLVKKGLERTATVALIISLLSWNSDALADSFRLAATNLQVVFDKSEASRSLDSALQKAVSLSIPPMTAPAPTVARASEMVARAIVRRLVQEDFQASVGLVKHGSNEYENEALRAAILETRVTPAAASATEDVLRTASLSSDVREGGVNKAGDVLVAHVQAAIQPEIEEISKRSPGAFGLWVKAVQDRYGTELGIWDAQEKIIAGAVGQAAGVMDMPFSSELANQSKELTREFGKKALSTWIDAKVKEFMANSLLAEVVHTDLHIRSNDLSFEATLSDDTKNVLNSVAGPDGERNGEWHTLRTGIIADDGKAMNEIASTLRGAGDGNVAPEVRESLLGYDAIFPSANRMMATMDDGGVSRAMASVAQGAMQMSMNFLSAARGGLARGVLFGREPTSGSVSISDIQWEVDNSRALTLAIRRTQGDGWISLGTFDAGIVNQALRFAADQRVVAVTLTSGRPVARLGIHLNPELVDTPLGCRVVQLDRFIDTLDRFIPRVHAHREAIGSFTDAMRIGAFRPKKVCEDNAANADTIHDLEQSRNVPIEFIKNLTQTLNGEPASLALVAKVHACQSEPSGEAILGCLCSSSKNPADDSLPRYIPTDLTSQVREKPFILDPSLSWMQRSQNGLGNLEFWLHVTLEKVGPDGGVINGPHGENTALEVNFSDSDLAELNAQMPALIAAYMGKETSISPSYRQFIQPIEQFVLLQRFFRAALRTELGNGFPKEKLIALERATRMDRKRRETIRWQVESSEQENALKELSSTEYRRWEHFEQDKNRDFCDAES